MRRRAAQQGQQTAEEHQRRTKRTTAPMAWRARSGRSVRLGFQANQRREQAERHEAARRLQPRRTTSRRRIGPALARHRPGIAHTFSTSARPSMPVGRKISTTIRIENAATSLYSTAK